MSALALDIKTMSDEGMKVSDIAYFLQIRVITVIRIARQISGVTLRY